MIGTRFRKVAIAIGKKNEKSIVLQKQVETVSRRKQSHVSNPADK